MNAVFLFILCLLLVGCTSASQPVSTTGETKEFDMVVKQYAFEPALITVNKGDTVKIHLTSSDVEHGISIPAFRASAIIPAGKTTDMTFVADKAGIFEYRCSVPCGTGHRDMLGAIEVTEATQ